MLNGLIVSQGAFPAYRVSHRGDVVDAVVTGALEVSERFGSLAAQVERMERRPMPKDEQIRLLHFRIFGPKSEKLSSSQIPLLLEEVSLMAGEVDQ